MFVYCTQSKLALGLSLLCAAFRNSFSRGKVARHELNRPSARGQELLACTSTHQGAAFSWSQYHVLQFLGDRKLVSQFVKRFMPTDIVLHGQLLTQKRIMTDVMAVVRFTRCVILLPSVNLVLLCHREICPQQCHEYLGTLQVMRKNH
jgi:hypothetical protein